MGIHRFTEVVRKFNIDNNNLNQLNLENAIAVTDLLAAGNIGYTFPIYNMPDPINKGFYNAGEIHFAMIAANRIPTTPLNILADDTYTDIVNNFGFVELFTRTALVGRSEFVESGKSENLTKNAQSLLNVPIQVGMLSAISFNMRQSFLEGTNLNIILGNDSANITALEADLTAVDTTWANLTPEQQAGWGLLGFNQITWDIANPNAWLLTVNQLARGDASNVHHFRLTPGPPPPPP